jgi:hypothetical protein
MLFYSLALILVVLLVLVIIGIENPFHVWAAEARVESRKKA